MTYTRVQRSTKDIIIAVLEAAIDDLAHTDNMTDRTNYELGYLDESTEYVSSEDMATACAVGIAFIRDMYHDK